MQCRDEVRRKIWRCVASIKEGSDAKMNRRSEHDRGVWGIVRNGGKDFPRTNRAKVQKHRSTTPIQNPQARCVSGFRIFPILEN